METILSLGIVAFLLFYLAFKIDDRHQAVKFISIFFGIFCILLISKYSFDTKDHCELVPVLENQTVITGSETDTFIEYDYICVTNTRTTTTTFYKLGLWYLRLMYVYLIGFISYFVLKYIVRVAQLKKFK